MIGLASLAWRLKGVIAIGLILVAAGLWHWHAVNKAYHKGELAERAKWEEQRRLAQAERDEERRTAQGIIDAQAARIIAQEQQIEAADADAARDFEAARGSPDPVVPDAWLRGLRRP